MTNEEIEDIVNEIIKDKGIEMYQHSSGNITVVSEKGMATGSKETFDKAMREVAQKYKQKQK